MRDYWQKAVSAPTSTTVSLPILCCWNRKRFKVLVSGPFQILREKDKFPSHTIFVDKSRLIRLLNNGREKSEIFLFHCSIIVLNGIYLYFAKNLGQLIFLRKTVKNLSKHLYCILMMLFHCRFDTSDLRLNFVETALDLVETLIHFVEAAFNLVKTALDLVETLIHFVEAAFNLVKTAFDLVETLIHFVEAAFNLVETLIYFVEPAFNLADASISYDELVFDPAKMF